MPMTCTAQSMQSQNTDIIDKIISPINERYLEACIEESLAALQTEFFPSEACDALEKLRSYARGAVHAHKVGIFFLLLNIDRQLKQRLMHADQNNAKLARFFVDLRQELVTVFFCSSQPVSEFVLKCKQGYLIA
jgi:hypothetical protein